MPDLFGKNSYLGGKVFAQGEEDDLLVPIEDTQEVFTEGEEGNIDITQFEDGEVFSSGEEGVIATEMDTHPVYVEGEEDEPVIDITPFEDGTIFTPETYVIIEVGDDMTMDEKLKEWAQGKDYQPLDITRDSEDRVTSATVKWPDGVSGILTMTEFNATHECYDGYTITHPTSGKTVVQAAVTRNVEGAIIYKPELVIV